MATAEMVKLSILDIHYLSSFELIEVAKSRQRPAIPSLKPLTCSVTPFSRFGTVRHRVERTRHLLDIEPRSCQGPELETYRRPFPHLRFTRTGRPAPCVRVQPRHSQ